MSDGLCDMALAGSAGSGDEDRGLFAEEAAGHEVVDQGGIDSGVEVEVELLDRLAGREAGPSVPQVEPALVAAGHFVADEQSQEVRVSHFGLDSLTVSGFEGMEDAGQPQLPEQVGEVGFRVHVGMLRLNGWMKAPRRQLPFQCPMSLRVSRQNRPLPV